MHSWRHLQAKQEHLAKQQVHVISSSVSAQIVKARFVLLPTQTASISRPCMSVGFQKLKPEMKLRWTLSASPDTG